ncbi:hypothetical protein Dimus_003597 [Dionaea muscipula]
MVDDLGLSKDFAEVVLVHRCRSPALSSRRLRVLVDARWVTNLGRSDGAGLDGDVSGSRWSRSGCAAPGRGGQRGWWWCDADRWRVWVVVAGSALVDGDGSARRGLDRPPSSGNFFSSPPRLQDDGDGGAIWICIWWPSPSRRSSSFSLVAVAGGLADFLALLGC